jgi:hypothetical protein
MLSGAMPRSVRIFYRFSPGVICLVFAGLGLLNFRAASATGATPIRALALFMVILALAAIIVVAQWRFERRLIAEFSYDGYMLQFRTLGIPETQLSPHPAIVKIKDWRGRSGRAGYRLIFGDGQNAYLEFSVSNSTELVTRLQGTAKL